MAGQRSRPAGPFCCYALQHSVHTQRSYTGQTNNFARRIRQHNGELRGGARYTSAAFRQGETRGLWSPIFRVEGFQTLRAVLQFEFAMKRRKVPLGFRRLVAAESKKDKYWTRGPTGRVWQLEYLLSLGRLNDYELHSPFARNGISVHVHVSRARYLRMAHMTEMEFEMRRAEQGVDFYFCGD